MTDQTQKSTVVGTEPTFDPVGTTHGFKQRLARQISWNLCSGNGEFEVFHTQWIPETAEVHVHDFTFTDEDGTEWRGSFRITIDRIDAYVEPDDDFDDWEDED